MKLSDFLDARRVLMDVQVKNKQELINLAMSVLETETDPAAFAAIKSAVFEREQLMSTGVGKGVAIPHAKSAGLSTYLMAFVILQNPVDYDAIDGAPVEMLFLIVGPADNRNHIRLLSRISKMMNKDSFRRTIKGCSSPDEVVAVFRKEEESSMDF